MTDLDVFRLSAKACDREFTEQNGHLWLRVARYENETWHPFTDDSQRWECVKKLLVGHESWMYLESLGLHSYYFLDVKDENEIKIACSADEFPARALAELESRKGAK